MTSISAPVIRSTGGPVAADDELDLLVADWRHVLGLEDNDSTKTEETPK
jgi:hypothetical protein